MILVAYSPLHSGQQADLAEDDVANEKRLFR